MFIHSNDTKQSVAGFTRCEKAGNFGAVGTIKTPSIIAVFTSGHHLPLFECVVAFTFHTFNSLENHLVDVAIGRIEPSLLPVTPEHILDIRTTHFHGCANFHERSDIINRINKCIDRYIVEIAPIFAITCNKARMDAASWPVERYSVFAVLFDGIGHSSVSRTQLGDVNVSMIRAGIVKELPLQAILIEERSYYRLVFNRGNHGTYLLKCCHVTERVNNLLNGCSTRRLSEEHRTRYCPRSNSSPHSNHPQIDNLQTAQAA